MTLYSFSFPTFCGISFLPKEIIFHYGTPLSESPTQETNNILHVFLELENSKCWFGKFRLECSCKGSSLNTSEISQPRYFSTFGPEINSRHSKKNEIEGTVENI